MPNAVDAGLHDEVAVDSYQPAESFSSVTVLPSGASARVTEPLPTVNEVPLGAGHAAWISFGSPFKSSPNEDAFSTIPLSKEQGLLLVADGLGGHRDGRRASQLIRSLLTKASRTFVAPAKPMLISNLVPVPLKERKETFDLRSVVLNEIERANQRLLRSRSGSATTLALVEINGRRVRTYHIGDSEILVVSQRGRLKFSSVSHSPIGYALESGMLTEEQALFHPDRHLVSNVIGSEQMSVELGPWITLSPRDTVLLASDGLFDNLMQYEIIDCIRKGKLADGVTELAARARQRMLHPDMEFPSKPDDLTILAYRPG
ncbi:MAG TPA: PP2C family serine/threonine-protein phosphatase [Planctomicrobium sp.]|nr:PP2C family serine/threonine-protein phosphatase [Planctomicrobium sp.]